MVPPVLSCRGRQRIMLLKAFGILFIQYHPNPEALRSWGSADANQTTLFLDNHFQRSSSTCTRHSLTHRRHHRLPQVV